MAAVVVAIKKVHVSAIVPSYQSEHAAGMDLHARLDEPRVIVSMERVIIPTGFAIELPDGYEAQIRARSGLSIKHGICLANGVGTIDADFRGEIGVLLINLGSEPFTVEPGMRIAQMIISRYERIDWETVDHLQESARGTKGYGSTGH